MLRRLFILFSVLLLSGNAWSDDFTATLKKFRGSSGTQRFFAEAYGYAVFPTIGKGGAGLGAAYGKGRVYRGNQAVGQSTMVQVSIGFQLGGQAFSQIVFFKNEAAYDRFTNGSFEFGVEASAVAITLGASARSGTTGTSAGGNESRSSDAKNRGHWTADMAVFTLAKGGFMYEATIGGQKFSFESLDQPTTTQ